jgi:drug/metabolite transporter (DMT)-like permease
MSKEKNTLIYVFLVVSMVFWGLSFIWYKQALEHFRPITVAFLRLLISVPLLISASLQLKRLKKIKKEDVFVFFVLGFFEPFLYSIGESYGMLYVSSTVASILIATIPIFTFIVANIFLNEKLTIKNYIGMMISFLGVVCVVFSEYDGIYATGKGIALLIIPVSAAVIYGFVIKKVSAKYSPLSVVTYQNLVACIFFIPVFFIVDFKSFDISQLTFRMFVPVALLAVFASTIAYIGLVQGIRALGVAKATVFANFIPVFTAIFAFFILKEDLNLLKVVGIIIAVGGLILTQKSKKDSATDQENIVVNELY